MQQKKRVDDFRIRRPRFPVLQQPTSVEIDFDLTASFTGIILCRYRRDGSFTNPCRPKQLFSFFAKEFPIFRRKEKESSFVAYRIWSISYGINCVSSLFAILNILSCYAEEFAILRREERESSFVIH